MKLRSNTRLSRTVCPSDTGRTPDATPHAPYGGVRYPVRCRPVPSGAQNTRTVRYVRALKYRFQALKGNSSVQITAPVRCVRCQNHLWSKSGSKRALNTVNGQITGGERIKGWGFRLKGRITPDAPHTPNADTIQPTKTKT